MLEVIQATENSCSQTYNRIQQQLAEIKELSRSNLALKRLIKRNAKRDGTYGKNPKLLAAAASADNVLIANNATKKQLKDVRCKLPFVVAEYTPNTMV